MATPKRSSRHSARRRVPRKAGTARKRLRGPGGPEQDPQRLPVDHRLVEGIALFNHRRFFECHDVLEQLWLQTQGRPRDFYRGLIQAAVAFYHWSRGNPGGALSLYRTSSQYLKRYRPEFFGVDVDGFLARYTELFGWLHRHRLRYEARLVPTIRWAHPPRAA